MSGIIYYAIFLCSIAFAIVVIYIGILLMRLAKTTEALSHLFGDIEEKINYITPKLQQSIQESVKALDDIGEKLTATDSVFETMENVGTTINAVNEMVHTNVHKPDVNEMKQKTKPFIDGIIWSEAALQLYFKWIKRNKPETIQSEKSKVVPIQGNEG